MKSLNQVFLMGNLASDVELRQTQKGHYVANFPLAVNRSTKGDDGQMKETVDYHRIIAWEGLGKICAQYLKKGTAVFISGRLMNGSYDDADGVRRYRTEIVADGMRILTPKKNTDDALASAKAVVESNESVEELSEPVAV